MTALAVFSLNFIPAQAATSYVIADVGTIDSVSVLDLSDVKFSPTNLAPFIRSLPARYVVSGSINTIETLNPGDKVTITIKNTPTSTYQIAGEQQFASVLNDGGGQPQFNVSYHSGTGVITLTKTTNTASGVFNFSMTSSNAPTKFNTMSDSSTFYVEGFELAGFTFPNKPKPETLMNGLCLVSGGLPRLNSSTLHLAINISRIYNSLLAGQNIETLYSTMMGQDVVIIGQLEPNNQIVAVDFVSTQAYFYDLMSNGTQLNAGFSEFLSTAATFTKVDISPDASPAEVESAMMTAGGGTYAVVKNSDNSWTTATNLGKILGDDVARYRTNGASTVNSMPNSPALNALNLALIQQSIDMKLMSERPSVVFMVRFADSEAPDSYTLNESTNITSCSYTGVYPDSYATNALEGQTSVKVHYVDRAGNPIEEVTNSYGFPVGSTFGTPNAPVDASPKAVSGYVLLTDPAKLADFATDQGVDASQVLATDAAIPFPTSGKTEVYYVYEKLFTITFDNLGADTATPIDQIVIEQTTIVKPTDPTKAGYTFDHWYISGGNEDEPFDFTTPITSNITLCAKWSAIINPTPPEPTPTNPSPTPFTPGAPNTGQSATTYQVAEIGAINSVQLTDAQGVVSTYPDATNPVTNEPIRLSINGAISDVDSLTAGDTVTIPIEFTTGNRLRFAAFQIAPNIDDSNGTTIFNVTSSGTLSRTITLTRTDNTSTFGGDLNFALNIALVPIGTDVTNCNDSDYVELSVANVTYKYTATPQALILLNNSDLRVTQSFNYADQLHFNNVVRWTELYQQILDSNVDTSAAKYNDDTIMIAKITPSDPGNIISASQGGAWAYMPVVKDDDLYISYFISDGLTNRELATYTLQPDMTQAQIEAALPAYSKAAIRNSDGSYTFAVNYGPALNNARLNLNSSANSSGSSFCAYRNDAATDALITAAHNYPAMAAQVGVDGFLALADPQQATTFTGQLLANAYFPVINFSGQNVPVNNSAIGQSRIVAHYVDLAGNAIDTVDSSWGWPDPNGAGETPSPAWTASSKSVNGYTLVTDAALLADFATDNSVALSSVLVASTALDYPTGSGNKLDVYFVYSPDPTKPTPISPAPAPLTPGAPNTGRL
jgi:uncharacterized repeat protein (TIGR02543 family)